MRNIECKNVSKSYDGKRVIKNFSHVFHSGETVCIMGPSGCGKTTLLKLLSGIEECDSGRIVGIPDRISYVFQEDRILHGFSAYRNIKFITGTSVSENKIDSIFERLGIGSVIHKRTDELSGGMQRRVSIARSLLYKADLYLMDEPLKGLDENTKKNVMETIMDMTMNKTLIIVTHDETEASYLNAKILRLDNLE